MTQPTYRRTHAIARRRLADAETRPFYLTSEFVASILAVAGIAITAASSEAFGAWRAWVLVSAVTIGYALSRGIAKSGSRAPTHDPRDDG